MFVDLPLFRQRETCEFRSVAKPIILRFYAIRRGLFCEHFLQLCALFCVCGIAVRSAVLTTRRQRSVAAFTQTHHQCEWIIYLLFHSDLCDADVVVATAMAYHTGHRAFPLCVLPSICHIIRRAFLTHNADAFYAALLSA